MFKKENLPKAITIITNEFARRVERKIVSLGSAVSEGEEDASLLGGAPSFCTAFRFDCGIKREKRGIMEHIEK